jgi:hypothetical protein
MEQLGHPELVDLIRDSVLRAVSKKAHSFHKLDTSKAYHRIISEIRRWLIGRGSSG